MVLVFPQAKPIGVNSASSRETITDGAAFPTEVIDYLKFEVFTQKENKLEDTIYLYLPKQLSEKHNQGWGQVNLGPAGKELVGIAAEAANAEGGIDTDSVAEKIKSAAQSAMPQIGYGAASKVINAAISATGGTANVSREQLTSIIGKKIFNPYAEATYTGQGNFRDHSWNWELVPKSTADATTIYDIIQRFRYWSLPGLSGGNKWLTIPEYFRVSTVRYIDKGGGKEEIANPGTGGAGGILSAIMQFPTKMVCTNVTVGMPDYTSLRSSYAGSRDMDFGALKYNLSLSFKETEFLTKQTYGELPEMQQQTQNENPGYTPEQQSFLDQVREILGDFGPFNSNNVA
tara:strand:+ start:536 stop:1570 length:1035 start_codon:yes stop_codon:yes gene_type:complete